MRRYFRKLSWLVFPASPAHLSFWKRKKIKSLLVSPSPPCCVTCPFSDREQRRLQWQCDMTHTEHGVPASGKQGIWILKTSKSTCLGKPSLTVSYIQCTIYSYNINSVFQCFHWLWQEWKSQNIWYTNEEKLKDVSSSVSERFSVFPCNLVVLGRDEFWVWVKNKFDPRPSYS